jgi:maleylacetoacetate isomerase
MRLYTYWRSSSAYRVRIALNLKGLDWESVPVHLVRDGGEQHRPEYRAVNPHGLVPALEDGELTLTESLAIIEYLEETRPEPALLPGDAAGRARVRSLALLLACGIQPLNNLGVLRYLGEAAGLDQDGRDRWYRHWVSVGFDALEARLAREPATGRFCHGDTPGLADCCLVPQVYNARRYGCDLGPYPTIARIDAECAKLEAFSAAAPEQQPDAG